MGSSRRDLVLGVQGGAAAMALDNCAKWGSEKDVAAKPRDVLVSPNVCTEVLVRTDVDPNHLIRSVCCAR